MGIDILLGDIIELSYLFFNLFLSYTGISFIMAAPFSLTMILFNKFLVFSLIYNDPSFIKSTKIATTLSSSLS